MTTNKSFGVLFFLSSLFIFQSVSAQYPSHPLQQYPENWDCQWITHPEIDESAYNLIHFRNVIELKELPEQFIVHISADNHYRLYVNGVEVCYGPQKGDIQHWRYETVDLAPFLKSGNNIIAAEVMNWGIDRSHAIISYKTALMLQGHSDKEKVLNTSWNSSWLLHRNPGVFKRSVNWIYGVDVVGGFYAANPTDSIVAASYPWGWKELGFDDSKWQKPEWILGKPDTNTGNGHGWILQPRTTAMQVSRKETIGGIVRSDLKDAKRKFNFENDVLEIPANSSHTILIDKGKVTLGYPKLNLSGGKEAVIRVMYTEALYDENNRKGNRNEIEGKMAKGISDVYVMDGGDKRIFQPLWFRAYRFIQLEINTGDEPLLINDFHNVYSASPISLTAKFNCDNPVYQEVWDICWHCLEICAQDNLMSDAYYEQMQYVGDLRPHLMGWSTLTGDLSYFRSAMEQFNNSRLPDGNITSCYPLKATFVHPTYSLIWIDMLHDLMMRDGEKKQIETYTGEIQEVFDYYESLINENGLVGKSNYQMFIDWYLPKGGNSKVNKDGNSAILTLNYAYTLQKASEIMNWLGYNDKAMRYADQSRKYAEITRKLCFDPHKGVYADDPEKTFYDQRASILAIMTGAHSEEEAGDLMDKLLNPDTYFDSYANLFYYFYLFEAMEKTGSGDFTAALQPWKDIVDMGMSATPEKRIEHHPRSEVHPWTAHPVHFYFSYVGGIRPTSPGYKTVKIEPHPGDLKVIDLQYPTKEGEVVVNLEFDKTGKAKGSIRIPGEMKGEFIFQDQKITLYPGFNAVN
jgi:alpha-L-rhamnosidase